MNNSSGKNKNRKQLGNLSTVNGIDVTHTDLSQKIMGDNALQGNNQASVRNERQAVPDTLQEATDVTDTFKTIDKDYRAKVDLGKGARK